MKAPPFCGSPLHPSAQGPAGSRQTLHVLRKKLPPGERQRERRSPRSPTAPGLLLVGSVLRALGQAAAPLWAPAGSQGRFLRRSRCFCPSVRPHLSALLAAAHRKVHEPPAPPPSGPTKRRVGGPGTLAPIGPATQPGGPQEPRARPTPAWGGSVMRPRVLQGRHQADLMGKTKAGRGPPLPPAPHFPAPRSPATSELTASVSLGRLHQRIIIKREMQLAHIPRGIK